MSPERMNGDDKSAANDIWSVGATFVHIITGQPLNYPYTTFEQLATNISQYKIFINGNSLDIYLNTLLHGDFKRKIIERTLCKELKRMTAQQLLRMLFSHSQRLPAEAIMAAREKNADISGMSYNSEKDELFLAGLKNEAIVAMRVRDNAGDLCNVYRAPHGTSPTIMSVCYMDAMDILLIYMLAQTPETIQLAGGAQPQRKRVLRGADGSRPNGWPADRRKRRHKLRAE